MSKKKFFCCIGNPPYQEDCDTSKDMPIYDTFMDAVFDIADKVELVTPARFLFDAGATPKAWNKKMLEDPHFKVHHFESDSTKMFPRASIKGGVAITYHDMTKEFEPIGLFTPFEELNSIFNKVKSHADFIGIDSITYSQSSYKIDALLFTEHPEIKEMTKVTGKTTLPVFTKGNEDAMGSDILNNLHGVVFFDTKPDDENEYVRILGRLNNNRTMLWINKKYVNAPKNFDKFKVFVPTNNGSGMLGEVLSTPMIGTPMIGHTQTFISIGCFDTENEAQNCMKYIKTKFARVMLGILKITQSNTPKKWRCVPLQDFTANSDIDWSQSVADIDRQLYEKYGLDDDEIAFIEKNVKAMP